MASDVSPNPLGANNVYLQDTNFDSQPNTVSPLDTPDIALDPGCALFEFILKVLLIGVLCLFGFAGNTISFIVLWRERGGSAMTFLLQAILLADLAVVWMLFIHDVIPALGYVVPILTDCITVCAHTAAVTRPLLFLARVCVVWLMLHAAASRYLTLSRPSSLHASVGTVDCARKQVVFTLITAFIFAIPLTFDSVLYIVHYPPVPADGTGGPAEGAVAELLMHNGWYRTIYLYVIQFTLLLLAPLLVVIYMSGRLLQLLRSVNKLRRALLPLQQQQQKEHTAQLTQVILTLCITLLVCYLPLTVRFVLEWAQPDQQDEITCGHLLYYLQDFANMFLALNSSIKVLMLTLFLEDFGAGVKSIFCGEQQKNTDSGPRMYMCQDIAEMTLISPTDGRL